MRWDLCIAGLELAAELVDCVRHLLRRSAPPARTGRRRWTVHALHWQWILLVLVVLSFRRDGGSATYGPANETCTTTGGTVLTPTGSPPWESTIEGASSGSVFLLQGGTYNFGTEAPGLAIPAGVTVKAYGSGTCANVIITGNAVTDNAGAMLTMGNNSSLRGVTLQATTTGNRHEQVLDCNKQNVSLVNNNLFGGTGDSFRIETGCKNFLLQGNNINGSTADNSNDPPSRDAVGGHNIHAPAQVGSADPDGIVIRGNKFCNDYFPDSATQKADDTIAIEKGLNWLVEQNYFPSGCAVNRENIFDIKSNSCSAAAGVIFRRNYIERNFYGGTIGGAGEPGGTFQSGLVIGDSCEATPVARHRVEYNMMGNCHVLPDGSGPPDSGGCGALGTGTRAGKWTVAHNVFFQDNVQSGNGLEGRIEVGPKAYAAEWLHNLYIRGRWVLNKLGTPQASGPRVIRDNIFYDVFIIDGDSLASDYTNSYNIFWSTNSTGLDFTHGNILTTDPQLRDVTGTALADVDFRLADGSPAIGTASDGTNRGPFQEITWVSGAQTGTAITLTFHSATLPLSSCTASLFDIEYNGIDATEVSCTPGPRTNDVTLSMSQAAPAGTTVTAKWSYGAVQDSLMLGGPEANLNNKVRARSTPVTIGNVADTPAWVQGNQVACSGANRIVLAAFCWEDTPTTASGPLTISDVRIGGQLGTKVVEVDNPDGELDVVGIYGALWSFTQAQLAAATNSTLTYATSQAPDPTRPILLSTGCYRDITDQAGPIADSDAITGSVTVQLPALTTTAPGAAALLACAATGTSWTVPAPWQERLDVTSGNTLSQVIADATTDGTPLTPEASGASSTRRVLLAVALDGGEDVVLPDVTQHAQTHVAIYQYGMEEGGHRVCPVDETCQLAPTRRFVARAQVEIERAPLPSTAFAWWCSDDGGEPYPVTANSTGWLSFSTSLRSGEILANSLPLDGDTFRACGTHYSIESSPAACAAAIGERLEYEFAGVISASAVPEKLVRCELRKGSALLLDDILEHVEIRIGPQQANGP